MARSNSRQHSSLLAGLIATIPAFYLLLEDASLHTAGRLLYLAAAILLGADLLLQRDREGQRRPRTIFDACICAGAMLSALPDATSSVNWHVLEWVLRLAYCGIVFARIVMLTAHWIAPHRLVQILVLAIAMLALAGAGFYWLEPKVPSYADGLWLAFITGATVGYGDLVPSTPASRIFAVFIVLLGYALFSIVTASIAALFVGEDEKRIEREFHADIRQLRKEVAALRKELGAASPAAVKSAPLD
jgi:voltage-gated potassium channel